MAAVERPLRLLSFGLVRRKRSPKVPRHPEPPVPDEALDRDELDGHAADLGARVQSGTVELQILRAFRPALRGAAQPDFESGEGDGDLLRDVQRSRHTRPTAGRPQPLRRRPDHRRRAGRGRRRLARVPVYEGFAIKPAIQRIDVAGRDVTNCLNILLRKEGHIFHRTSELEIVRDIKEKVCFVSSSVHSAKDDKELKSYVMPDGSTIKIGAAHHQTPEALFRPDLIGCEYAGVSQCIVNAIRESAFELRKELCANVLLSGGTTMFPGFGERVLQDMKKAFQPQDLKIKIYAPADLLSCTRTGGSILATLATFRKIVITKAQYENEGNGLARKAY